MKNRKRQFRWFSIVDYEKEAEYLRDQHKKGWKFKNVIFPGIYYFETCEPEDVVYQLDYNQEGIANSTEYVQMFQDCGWEYILDFVGYSYFRKPAKEMNGEETIFCDDESRLDMMKRIFNGRMVPLLVIMLGIIIPQFVTQTLNNGFFSALPIFFVLMLVLYVSIFIQFGISYFRFRKRIR